MKTKLLSVISAAALSLGAIAQNANAIDVAALTLDDGAIVFPADGVDNLGLVGSYSVTLENSSSTGQYINIFISGIDSTNGIDFTSTTRKNFDCKISRGNPFYEYALSIFSQPHADLGWVNVGDADNDGQCDALRAR